MPTDINIALREALARFENNEKYLRAHGDDDWESRTILFIRDNQKNGLYAVNNYYWYNHVIFAVPKTIVKETNYHKISGYAFMRIPDFMNLLDIKKTRLGAETTIINMAPLKLEGVTEVKAIMMKNL